MRGVCAEKSATKTDASQREIMPARPIHQCGALAAILGVLACQPARYTNEMWFPVEGTQIYECRESAKHAIAVATTNYCEKEWVDPWLPESDDVDLVCASGRQLRARNMGDCPTTHSSVAADDELYGLPTGLYKGVYCDGRMVVITGTVRRGSLVRVTAIEPE